MQPTPTPHDSGTAELRTSEDYLRTAFEHAAIGMAMTCPDGSWLAVNPALCELLGYERAELLDRQFLTFAHPDDRDADVAHFRDMLASDAERFQVERRLLHRDGHSVWVSLTVAIIRNEDGSARYALAQMKDITERKQAEEGQRRQTETLQTILDHIPAMVAATNAAGEMAYANSEWTRLTGWTLDEVRRPGFFVDLYPDPIERARSAEFLRTASGTPTDFRVRTRDGRILETTWVCVANSDGSVVAFGQDVTDRKRLEDQLRQGQKLEAVGRLAGGVAHDFNNLLTVIQSSVSFLLLDTDSSDPRRRDVLQIRDAGARAADLTRQLLAYSRQQVLKPLIVDVNKKVENVEQLLRRVIGEDVIIQTEFTPTVWPVLADPGQLEQVLMNLAVNARDAMPAGGVLRLRTDAVEIDAERVRSQPGLVAGSYVSIVVEDSGVGIAPDVMARVFEPFYTTKSPGKGTGLGLSTVYGIVKQSGGHVYVESVLGKGSRFTVLLPRYTGGESDELDAAPPLLPRGTERILVAEDEPPVRAAVRRMLERLGYKVVEASNGAEALGIIDASRERIDLVLTDVVMPDVDGRLLAECMEGKPRAPRVVYMSGYTDDHVLRRGLAQPGTAYLQKPFTTEALARIVRDVLDARSGVTAV